LKGCVKGRFYPFFYIQADYTLPEEAESRIEITEETLQAMISQGTFALQRQIEIQSFTGSTSIIRISLCLQPTSYSSPERCSSISGFPCKLVQNALKSLPVLSSNPELSDSYSEYVTEVTT